MRRWLIGWCSLLLTNALNGQVPATETPPDFVALMAAADKLIYQDFEKSDSLYQVVEDYLVQAGIENFPVEWVSLNNRRALGCAYNSRYELAGRYVGAAWDGLEKYDKRLGRFRDSLRHSVMFAEAIYQRDVGQYDEALENLKRVQDFTASSGMRPQNCQILFRVLQFQASIYNLNGEFESAINSYLASNAYYDCYRDKGTCANYILTFRNVGLAFLGKGDRDHALQYFWKAKDNVERCMADHPNAAVRTHALVLYHALAECYVAEDPDSARFYLGRATPLISNNPAFYERIHASLGRVAMEQGRYEEALRIFDDVREMLVKNLGEKSREVAKVYEMFAALYARTARMDSALWYIQKAVNSLTGKVLDEPENLRVNPRPGDVVYRKQMIRVLHRKAGLLSEMATTAASDSIAQVAWKTARLALALVDSTRNDFSLEKDKVVLADDAAGIYETALSIAAQLYARSDDSRFLEECFALMDRAKGAVLLDHLRRVRNFSRIPEDVIRMERLLKAELSAAEEALFQAESHSDDASAERMTLAELKQKYASLYDHIEGAYPAYYRLRTGSQPVSLKAVQTTLLREGQGLLQYFVGETMIYICFVTQARAQFFAIPNDSLGVAVEAFRSGIAGARPGSVLRNLENMLVAPWREGVASEITSLIIMPHGALAYLPFEVMRWNEDALLLDRFDIAYASSAALLMEQMRMEGSGESFAGFNAGYDEHALLPPLPGSAEELEGIREKLKDATLFMNATAGQFRKDAPDFKVVHLALHSLIDDERPLFSRLVFTQEDSTRSGDITVNELYGMELGADLVVLSACESGIGKLSRGEGMMSLSRAFMYAGVPSTVMSLWKVPDQATSRLMTRFYAFLVQGQSKDVALANAKREFIRDYPQMASPYYWAGFIVNGKTDPVSFSSPWRVWPIALAVVLIGGIGGWIGTRRRKRRGER